MGHNAVFQDNNKQKKQHSVCVELFNRAREKKCFPAIPMWLVKSPLFINSAVVDQIWRDDSDELRYDHLLLQNKKSPQALHKGAYVFVCRNFSYMGKIPIIITKNCLCLAAH